MRAFVLSGGGNRGALQVGALQALIEAGVRPELIVGSSVGAINGAYLAYDPTPAGAQALGELWSVVTRDDLYPGNHLTALWSVLRGKESLFTNARWRRFLSDHVPCETFGDLQLPCYVTATELSTGTPHFFGDDPDGCIIDALMASCALPPFHPPYGIGGAFYIDGGATFNLPLQFALAKGATEIYALNIVSAPTPARGRTLVDVSARAVETMVQHQSALALEHCALHRHVRVHQMDLVYEGELEPWDFSRTDELVRLGRAAATRLITQTTTPPEPTWQERLALGAEALVASLAQATSALTAALWPKEAVEQRAVVHVQPGMGD